MQTSYSFLRNAASLLKFLGYLGLILAAGAAIIIILMDLNGGIDGNLIGLGLSFTVIISSLVYLLLLLLISALIELLCDIADNTKRSADALENKTE